MKNSYKKYYEPINFILIYLIGTELLYFFGPLKWKTENIITIFLFLFISNVLLYMGYKSTMHKLIRKDFRIENTNNNSRDVQKKVLRYLRFTIPFNLIMTIANLLRYSGLESFSIGQIIEKLFSGLSDPGTQYNAKFENKAVFGGDLLAPISTALAPLLWAVLPLSLFYFRKLSKLNKTLIVFTIFFEITRWISVGTNKGVIDVFLIFLSIFLLRKNTKTSKHKRKNNGILLGIVVIFLIFGLYFFSNSISSRVGDSMLIVQSLANNTQIDTNSLILKIVPDFLKVIVIYITLYLTQGYQGLSLTFSEQFIPMFGIGNSSFLMANLQPLFNMNLFSKTYQYRIQSSGWDAEVNWHTIYSWLANDISYIGVLILMFFIGKYIAIVYFRSIQHKNVLNITLFSLIVIMIFYFPMNNQITAAPNTFMTFWVFNIFWLIEIIKSSLKKSL